MSIIEWRRSFLTVATLATIPGVVAGRSVDPATIAETTSLVRFVASFVLVLLAGGLLLAVAGEFVDRAVDSSMETPVASVGYGLMAQAAIVFLGYYLLGQLAGVSGAIVDVAFVVIGVLTLALAGLGFTVVGVRITELVGDRRLSLGAVVGAALSAVVWLVPSFLLGLVLWLLVVSLGVGGPTEAWLHASRSVDGQSGV